MKFKYSAVGKNTSENREYLKKLGYAVNYCSDNRFIKTSTSGTAEIFHYKAWIYNEVQPIDCCYSDELFRAITAMQDRNDYMQWFTDGNVWKLCLGKRFSKWCYTEDVPLSEYLNFSFDAIHKATINEVLEHFKKNNL